MLAAPRGAAERSTYGDAWFDASAKPEEEAASRAKRPGDEQGCHGDVMLGEYLQNGEWLSAVAQLITWLSRKKREISNKEVPGAWLCVT